MSGRSLGGNKESKATQLRYIKLIVTLSHCWIENRILNIIKNLNLQLSKVQYYFKEPYPDRLQLK